jgi:hypothetical protein
MGLLPVNECPGRDHQYVDLLAWAELLLALILVYPLH